MTRHRCEMVRLSIEHNPKFSLSLYETENTDTNYTYQTLQHMHQTFSNAKLYFILGADSLFDFEKWKYPEKLCDQAVILAAVRDSLTESKVDRQIQYLSNRFQGEIHRLDTPNFNVSSKIIRNRLEQQQTIRYMIPESVEAYIYQNQLYRKEASCYV